MMTPEEYQAWKVEQLAQLDPVVRAEAIQILRKGLSPAVQQDLRERIAENPTQWLHGRPEKMEMGLHHGWGTQIRNMLRSGGVTDARVGGNLDDVYSQLIELAVREVNVPPETLLDYQDA